MSRASVEHGISKEVISNAGASVGLGALAEVNRLRGTDFYLWGSQGRAIAAIAYEKNTDHLTFEEVQHCFKAKDDGWLDIDFTFAVDAFSWDESSRLCEDVYAATQETVVMDPHCSLIHENRMYTAPFTSRRSFVYDLRNSITITFPNGTIKCAGLETQLALLGRPDIELRPKYARYMEDYIQRFPEFAHITHQSVSAHEYELLLRKHGIDKSIPKFLYHSAFPTERRGEFAQMRNILLGKKKSNNINPEPGTKVLNFRNATPLYL